MNRPRNESGKLLRAGEAYGTILSKHHCDGVILSELRHEGRTTLPEHMHELGFFCLLLKGSYSEHCGSKTIPYSPFTMVFHPPRTVHEDEIGKNGGHFFKIEIQDGWLDRMSEYAPLPVNPVEFRGGHAIWLATRLYREYRNLDASSSLVIEGLVLEMLGSLARTGLRPETRPPAWLLRIVDLLHVEFRQNVTLSRLSAEAGVHPMYLARVFRKFYKHRIGEYIRQLRVEFACRELSNHELGLAEVALAAGFADQSHLTRVFKQVTGITPGAYREAFGPRAAAKEGKLLLISRRTPAL